MPTSSFNTRDDGPARRQRRRISWGYALIFAILGIAGCYLGFRMLLNHYLQSDDFLVRINHAVSRALQVEGAFEPLEWQDAQAKSASFSGSGVAGAPVRKIHAQVIEAHLDLRSLWDGVWDITELTIKEARVELAGNDSPQIASGVPIPQSSPGKTAGYIASLLPNRTHLQVLKIESANFQFPLPGGEAAGSGRAQRLRITARPLGDQVSDGYQLTGYGGDVYLSDGRRQLSLLDFDTRWRQGVLYISDAVADVKDSVSARVRCTGRIDTNVRGGSSELALQLSGIDVEEIISADWKQRLSGLIEGDVTVDVDRGRTAYHGEMSLVGGVLHTLPILDNLADFTKHDTFRRLPLNRATVQFSRTGDIIRCEDILIESSGTLRVTGALDVVDGTATGTLLVGVIPGVLRWIPGAEQKVFTHLEDGHLWTEMRVYGPLHALNEDLSSRLATGAIAQTIQEVPERAIDAGAKVIQRGTSILRTGVRSGIDLIDGFVPFLGD